MTNSFKKDKRRIRTIRVNWYVTNGWKKNRVDAFPLLHMKDYDKNKQ